MSYREIEKQVLYKGKKVRLEVHHLEDEETGRRVQREVVVHPGAVVVLAFLPDQRLLLIRNRCLAGARSINPAPRFPERPVVRGSDRSEQETKIQASISGSPRRTSNCT